MHKSEDIILDILPGSCYIWPQEMYEKLILAIFLLISTGFRVNCGGSFYLWEWVGIFGVCSRRITAWEEIFSHDFSIRRGECMSCRSASCASCYRADSGIVFPMNKPLGGESMYYRSSR